MVRARLHHPPPSLKLSILFLGMSKYAIYARVFAIEAHRRGALPRPRGAIFRLSLDCLFWR
jgi:hypothetical protein